MKNLNYLTYIQYYFEYIIKKCRKVTDNPLRKICENKRENTITFIITAGCYLERLTPETMELLSSTKSKIIKVENGENLPHLEITEVVLVYCNVVSNDYQHDLRVLYTFVPNKSFGQLLDMSPKNFIFKRAFNSEFY